MAMLIIIALLLAWDVWPYRASFNNFLDQQLVTELKTVGALLKEEYPEGRVLARESYNPHTDTLYAYSDRASGFYWLNWMAPKDISQYMLGGIYRKLHRPETIAEALSMAGWANVRFIVYDLTQGPLPPATELLSARYSGKCLAVFENTLYKPYANLLSSQTDQADGFVSALSGDSGVIRKCEKSGSDTIVAQVELEEAATLMVAESWFPGWRASVDGREVPIDRAQKAFIAVDLEPGVHTVRFEYHRQWYFYAGATLSLLALGACLGLLLDPKRLLAKFRSRARQ